VPVWRAWHHDDPREADRPERPARAIGQILTAARFRLQPARRRTDAGSAGHVASFSRRTTDQPDPSAAHSREARAQSSWRRTAGVDLPSSQGRSRADGRPDAGDGRFRGHRRDPQRERSTGRHTPIIARRRTR
jgi:hypothetical protein